MFFHSRSYKNSCFTELVNKFPCANDLQLQRFSQKCCFEFCAFGFEDLLLDFIACPWRFATTDLVCVSKTLVFEIEIWL